jgi:antitoxin component YwqK of YwqJK toxin-antitoxin module
MKIFIILFLLISYYSNSQVTNIKSLTSAWTKGIDDKGIEGYFLKTQEGVTWNYFYNNGNSEREISYDLEGKQHGKSTTYWDNGQIHITKSYNHGIENDYRFSYFVNGQFESKDYVSKRAPFRIKYAENGQLIEAFYNCSFPTGDKPNKSNCQVGYCFDFCGEKDLDSHHSQSFVEGINIKKWSNDKTCFEGKISNGVQDGKWTFYYEDGTKSSETYFKNGIQDSIFESWFPNGKLNTRIVIDKNSIFKVEDMAIRKYGYKETYYNNGQMKYKEEEFTKTWYFPNGQLLKTKTFEKIKCGETNSDFCLKIKDCLFTEYNSDGSIAQKGNYINGLKVGFWIENYNNDGEKSCNKAEGNYLSELNGIVLKNDESALSERYVSNEGIRDGIWKYFTIDGKIIFEENYQDGLLNGIQRDYYENGKIESEATYLKGIICERKDFYESGKLKLIYKFKDGEVIEETNFDE